MLYFKSLFWWLSAFWQRYQQLIFLTVIAVIAGIILISSFNILPKKGRKIALVGQFSLNNLPSVVADKISYGLTQKSEGHIIPGIARYWKISDKGKTYAFYLNNLRWHDGSRVTTKDLHLKIKQAQIIDQNSSTLIIKLKQPFSPLPSFLTLPLFKSGLIGVGNYRVTNYKLNSDQTLKYITLEQIDKPLNFLDKRLTYVIFASYDEAKNAFLMGQVDVLPNLLSVDEFKSFPNIKITAKTEKDKVVSVFLNLKNTYLADKNFRQALNYATPKFNQYPRAITPINPDSPFFNPNVQRYNYNLDKAKSFFAKSKIASGGAKIKLNLVTRPQFLNQAEKIKNSWQRLNDRIIVKIHVNYIPNPLFDALIRVIKIPIDPDQYYFWHSTQTTNISHLKDAKIDQLLEDGRKEIDSQKRKEIYLSFQKYLVNQVPAIFLYHPITYQIKRTRSFNLNFIKSRLKL